MLFRSEGGESLRLGEDRREAREGRAEAGVGRAPRALSPGPSAATLSRAGRGRVFCLPAEAVLICRVRFLVGEAGREEPRDESD